MNEDVKRLIKNLIAILIIAGVLIAGYLVLFSGDESDLEIEDTPITIESIRTIAEISTVSYSDEVVMDTVENYDQSHAIYDPREWQRWYYHDIKRQLTLIVKGEVKYGINLSDDNYKIENKTDTIIVHLPSPEIMDVIISPSRTEVFLELGEWNDGTRKQLELKARQILKDNAVKFRLHEKAEKNTIRLFERLIQTDKQLIIEFDEE